jgi:signal peptidase I
MIRSLWWVVPGLAGVAGLVMRRLLVVVQVHGESMRPAFAAGDTLLGVRCRRLERGRSVVFRMPDTLADPLAPPYRIKRVAAVAGDPTPPWVRGEAAGSPVPAGCLVVRGDAEGSEDSRHHGYVNQRDVLAVIVGRIVPNRPAAMSRTMPQRTERGQ